jgi:hypothetical protein
MTEKYIKMGAGQFLRDFQRDFKIKKSMAHRKAVMEREQKAQEKQMKVHLPEIEQDRSTRKEVSHTRLVALVKQVTSTGIVRLYKKNELQKLCRSYNCRYLAKWNKAKLANELCHIIQRHNFIPCHQITSIYVTETCSVDQGDARILPLRIRRL